MRMGTEFTGLSTLDSRQLPLAGLQNMAANLSIDETSPSFTELREAVRKLKGGKAAGT